jgi:hypothetical protein
MRDRLREDRRRHDDEHDQLECGDPGRDDRDRAPGMA